MKYIIQNANTPELRLLRGKTIECISLIGLAVGAEKFTAGMLFHEKELFLIPYIVLFTYFFREIDLCLISLVYFYLLTNFLILQMLPK